MPKAINLRRVQNLEADGGLELSPAAKKWLGETLTEEEQRALDVGEEEEPGNIDEDDMPEDVREWLEK